MREPVRIALVGLGDIAVRAHLPALAREPRTEVVALVDPDSSAIDAAAALAPGARIAGDVEDVLADPAVDAVVLATPPWVTAGLARAALEAGKYVLAEKPLAPTLVEQLELRTVAGAAERLQIGLTYRHHPSIERICELVRTGALGRPLYVQASLCDERADPVGDPDHYARRLRGLEHGPPVVLDGIHRCDQLNLILGEAPVGVQAWALTSSPDFAAPNVNGAALTYRDGSIVRLEVIWLLPVLPPSQFVLTGPRGRVVVDQDTFALEIETDGVRDVVAAPGDKTEACFARQLDVFVTACLHGTPPVPGLEDAIAASELSERIAQASSRSEC